MVNKVCYLPADCYELRGLVRFLAGLCRDILETACSIRRYSSDLAGGVP